MQSSKTCAEERLRPATGHVPSGLGTGVAASKALLSRMNVWINVSVRLLDAIAAVNGKMRLRCGKQFHEFDAKDFIEKVEIEELRSKELVEWLNDRDGMMVSVSTLDRVGFLDEIYTKYEHSVHEYDISRIVFTDRKLGCVERGRYAASSDTSGGSKSFWPCIFYAMEISAACTLQGQSVLPDRFGRTTEYFDEVDLRRTRAERADFMDAIDRFCITHPGVFLRISLPGSRCPSKALATYHASGERVFCRDTHGQCVRAALANSIHAVSGHQEACDMLRMGDVIVPSLSKAQVWVEKNFPTYSLELFEKPFEFEVDDWLKQTMKSEAVLVVRLIGRDVHDKTVDHCVTINAVKQRVLDSCEACPLFARAGVLGHCVGDGVRLERIEDVRRLVRQPKRKGKIKKRRNPHERERKRAEIKKRGKEVKERDERKKMTGRRVTEDDDE